MNKTLWSVVKSWQCMRSHTCDESKWTIVSAKKLWTWFLVEEPKWRDRIRKFRLLFTWTRTSLHYQTGVGKCPVLNIPLSYLLDMLFPIIGGCSIGTFTNPSEIYTQKGTQWTFLERFTTPMLTQHCFYSPGGTTTASAWHILRSIISTENTEADKTISSPFGAAKSFWFWTCCFSFRCQPATAHRDGLAKAPFWTWTSLCGSSPLEPTYGNGKCQNIPLENSLCQGLAMDLLGDQLDPSQIAFFHVCWKQFELV